MSRPTRSQSLSKRLTVLVLLAALSTIVSGCASAEAAGTSVEIGIRYSRFHPANVTVPRGRPVTFVIRNDDPIDHEWIIGSEAVHEAHRTGSEAHHDGRPTEVTVPALSTRETTVTLAEAGSLEFLCHLPGHEAYGMSGTLTVEG
ncbi:MAG: cupredoxin domain-containing protein [Chloroflexi bacterium]|nr:cupredoxin domain-containing protein [Chloroflexota bacterium]